ncbi:unnamed protein product [Protopolystoma xenopodis]|uniref:Uncharacterized protein n=1 Tax=Protopolystoma xenopodis TaxID=117903 RepID=A0A448WBH0_9PLAT|nr:unnamed protein product [Protopolystoma xenopodis]
MNRVEWYSENRLGEGPKKADLSVYDDVVIKVEKLCTQSEMSQTMVGYKVGQQRQRMDRPQNCQRTHKLEQTCAENFVCLLIRRHIVSSVCFMLSWSIEVSKEQHQHPKPAL